MRIPSLDGLRGVSILLVLLAHVVGTRHAPNLAWIGSVGDVGNLGVRVFFVVSGFLMTLLLERERESRGRISMADFLRRRATRILPAFGAYLAAIAVLSAAGCLALRRGDLLASATFTMNYHVPRSWYVGHLWSLSVEAQFYVGWALLSILAGRSRMRLVAIAALVFAPTSRVAIWVFAPHWRWMISEALPTMIDPLAAGSLLATLQPRLARHAAYHRFLCSTATGIALPVIVLALNAAMPHIAFSYPAGETLMNLVIAVGIHRAITCPATGAARFLNAKAVAGMGVISYSLYLWQQLFLDRESAAPTAAFPLNVALAIGMALLSYRFVERPALAFGRRVGRTEHRASTHAGRTDLRAYVAVG